MKYIHLIAGVCPFYDTIGKRLQMGSVSCLSDDPSQNCTTSYPSTSVYKCKINKTNTTRYHKQNKERFLNINTLLSFSFLGINNGSVKGLTLV